MDKLKKQIEDMLSAFWDERALVGDTSQQGEVGIESVIVPLDSFSAVEILAELDAFLGVHTPDSVIKNGGYTTKEEFVNNLSDQVMCFLVSIDHE
ncbi:hypothetical protein [Rheinheimera soli]|uniref:hypothetical protein n=1 Tax=Rheinheimera soli TaxID=443616 RepID=UPI001E644645|nr:hypothetical protein [Rheinheimera soli]